MGNSPKFFGKATVGAKGQIVIPAEARKELGLKPGDSVMIMSGPPDRKHMITIVTEDEFSRFLKFLEDNLTAMKHGALKKRKISGKGR